MGTHEFGVRENDVDLRHAEEATEKMHLQIHSKLKLQKTKGKKMSSKNMMQKIEINEKEQKKRNNVGGMKVEC